MSGQDQNPKPKSRDLGGSDKPRGLSKGPDAAATPSAPKPPLGASQGGVKPPTGATPATPKPPIGASQGGVKPPTGATPSAPKPPAGAKAGGIKPATSPAAGWRKGPSKGPNSGSSNGDSKSQQIAKEAGKAGAQAAAAAVIPGGQTAIGQKVAGVLGEKAGALVLKLVAGFMVATILILLVAVFKVVLEPKTPLGKANPATLQSKYMPTEAVTAYRTAVPAFTSDQKYGGQIPWGILAGIAITATEHGKVSPYPTDLCDRRPSQPLLRTKPGLSPTLCTPGGGDAYPLVNPKIGDPTNGEGRGPYLLLPGAVGASKINFDRIDSRSSYQKPQTATEFITSEIDRIRRELVSSGTLIAPKAGDSEAAKQFWAAIIARLPLADGNNATCNPSLLPQDAAGDTVAIAVAQTWRCVLLSRALYAYAFDTTNTAHLIDYGAVDTLVNEALGVTWAFSTYGKPAGTTTGNVPTGCKDAYTTTTTANADGTKTTTSVRGPNVVTVGATEPAGLFPLDQATFERYAQNPSVGRCDAAANIFAAATAVADGEHLLIADRTGVSSYDKAAGGWRNIPYALGDLPMRERLNTTGPMHQFDPLGADLACAQSIDTWVNGLAASGVLASAAGLQLDDLNADGFPDQLAAEQQPLIDAVAVLDPRKAGGVCADWKDGSVEDYAASVAYSKQTVSEVVADGGSTGTTTPPTSTPTSTPDTTIPVATTSPSGALNPTQGQLDPSAPVTPNATTTTTTTTMPEIPTTLAPSAPSALDMGFRGVYALMEFFGHHITENVMTPAIPGHDSLILRLSPNGRAVEGVPLVTAPVASRVTQILRIAQALGPLVINDPGYKQSITVEEFDTILKETLPSYDTNGGAISGVPPVLMAALNSAVVKAKAEPGLEQCTLDGPLLAAIAYAEGGLWWKNIGADGKLVPSLRAGIKLGGKDYDNGVLDQDPAVDWALGIFQFAPATWFGWPQGARRADPLNQATWYGYARDGNNDNNKDIQNVWDEGYSAAVFVCSNAGANNLLTWDGALQGLGVYVAGGNWNTPTKIAATEKLVHTRFDKAAEYRAQMLSGTNGITFGGAGTNSSGVAVPPELLAYGNGQIPRNLLALLAGRGGHRLYSQAAAAFERFDAAARAAGIDLGITDSYRDYGQQVACAAAKGLTSNGGLCATPGHSDHGWAMAVDLNVYKANNLAWAHTNDELFGFCPNVRREPWHFTWVGVGNYCNTAWSPTGQATR